MATPDLGSSAPQLWSRAAGRVHVLEVDPELGRGIPADEFARAREELVAPTLVKGRGAWDPPPMHGLSGFLILNGVLARDVLRERSESTELLGRGDVLKPLPSPREDIVLRSHVLEPLTLAVLDEQTTERLADWPEVTAALLERALRRSLRTPIHQALLQVSPIEQRLLALFWFLAERWGLATPDGVALSLHLPHPILGRLMGCPRDAVDTAVARVERAGLLRRRGDAMWVLSEARA